MPYLNLDSPVDHEMITLLCNYVKNDKESLTKVSHFYDFKEKTRIKIFFNHIFTSCSICHSQCHRLPYLVKDILNILDKNFVDQFLDSCEDALRYIINKFKTRWVNIAAFFGNLIRLRMIRPKHALNIILDALKLSIDYFTSHCESFTMQLLFWCGDVLLEEDRELTEKLIEVLKMRKFDVMLIAENNFELCCLINDTEGIPFCDYVAFRNDDVSYLQRLCADPNFNINREFETPVWEFDPIFSKPVSLIAAAAYYGASKCFNFLSMSGASLNGHFQPTQFGKIGIGSRMNVQNPSSKLDPDLNMLTTKDLFFEQTRFWLKDKCALSFNVGEFAIAGNSLDIIYFMDSKCFDKPLSVCAAYNRRVLYEYFRQTSSISCELEIVFFNCIRMNDNHIYLREALEKHWISDEAISNVINSSFLGYRCNRELVAHSRNTPLFNKLLLQQNLQTHIATSDSDIILMQYQNYMDKSLVHVLSTGSEEQIRSLAFKMGLVGVDSDSTDSQSAGIWSAPLRSFEILLERKDMLELLIPNFLPKSILNDRLDIVEMLLKREDYRTQYTQKELLQHTVSIEMRDLIRSKVKK